MTSEQPDREPQTVRRPRVSVVMPVYKAPPVLERAVQCVLDQSLTSWELICVDDASPDETLARLNEIASWDPRIRVVALPANRGEGGARNAGIDVMRGDYLFCMDPDDEVPPTALEHLLAAAERTGTHLVMSRYDWLRSPDDPRTPPTEISPEPVVMRLQDSEYMQAVPGSHWCNLYSRELVQELGLRYVEDLAIGCDQLLQADAMLLAGDTAYLDEVTYIYHHYNPDSLTKGTLSFAFYLSDIEYNRRIVRKFDAVGLRDAAVRRVSNWQWSIREYWVRIPESLTPAQASVLFQSVRELVAEFGVTEPWVETNRPEYQELMALIVAGQDLAAYDYIVANRERMS